ncbi:MAG: pilin [Tepidiphilus sp.]|nr:pilin [Tepidiphilus sp.]
MPAYQDYTKRAHVGEGLALAAGAKAAVTEYYSSNNRWPSNNASAGLASSSSITGNAVSSVAVASGLITITYNNKVDSSSPTLLLSPTATAGGVTWKCKAGTISTKWIPSNCR